MGLACVQGRVGLFQARDWIEGKIPAALPSSKLRPSLWARSKRLHPSEPASSPVTHTGYLPQMAEGDC